MEVLKMRSPSVQRMRTCFNAPVVQLSRSADGLAHRAAFCLGQEASLSISGSSNFSPSAAGSGWKKLAIGQLVVQGKCEGWREPTLQQSSSPFVKSRPLYKSVFSLKGRKQDLQNFAYFREPGKIKIDQSLVSTKRPGLI